MTTTVDPFAAAQVSASKSTAPAEADPFVSAHDTDDPFAVSSDFKGGDFTPSPPIELLRGRLLALFPREFDPKAKNPFYEPGKDTPEFRELYTVDLYVLDGGPFVFPYKSKGDPEKGTQDEYKDYDAGDITPASAFGIKRFWVPQGNLISKIKHSHRKGAPLLGVLDLFPQKAGRDRGVTAAQIRTEYDAWVKRGKVGSKPQIAWALDDPNPERRAAAIGWWAANKADIAAINTASAPPES